MAFIPVLHTAQLQITGTKDGIPVENVFNVYLGVPWTAAQLETLVNATITYWDNNAPPLLPSDVTLNEVIATDQSTQIGIQHQDNFDPGTVGTLGGQPLPNNVSKLVILSTGYRGRSARGGIHWMGFTEGVVDVNTIQATHLNAIDIFLTDFKALIADEGVGTIVVVSRTLNKVPRVTGAVFPVLEFTFANNRTGSMAGRLK